jgi:hypothetical protein
VNHNIAYQEKDSRFVNGCVYMTKSP